MLEGGIQELDIKTGRVLFEWHSIDHVQLVESYYHLPRDPGRIFDYFHVNSIEIDHDGNLLVSARNTHTIYKISRRTGKILWRLGGKRSDFTLGPSVRVCLATRRPAPAGRRSDALRQLRRSTGSQAVARTRPPPGHEADARRRRPELRAIGRRSSRSTRRTCSGFPEATTSSAGATSRDSPSSDREGRSSSTVASDEGAWTPTARIGFPGSDGPCGRRSP